MVANSPFAIGFASSGGGAGGAAAKMRGVRGSDGARVVLMRGGQGGELCQ